MTLEELHAKCRKCTRCRLRIGATHVVPGEGNPKAEIVFVGEAPGENEDKEGRPFCGAAGKLLDKMLLSIGIKRKEVFIGNVIKCRPPQNRDPLEDELLACEPWLDKQLEIIKPKVIVTLGRFSLAKFLPTSKISEVHGKVFEKPPYVVIPLYHPAVGLYKATMRKQLMQDFRSIRGFLEGKIKPESIQPEVSKIKNLLSSVSERNSHTSQTTLF